MSHLSPGHDNWILDVVPLQHIQVSRWLSQLNPCPISPSAKSQDLHLTPSQAPRFISPLHPGTENCIRVASRSPQTHSGLKMWMSNASRPFLTYIQDPRFLSHLHPCTVSPPSRHQDSTKAPIYAPQLHLGRISPPSRAHLTSIQIPRIASQPHHSPISPYPGLKMYIPSQSRSDLTHIHCRFAPTYSCPRPNIKRHQTVSINNLFL